jgi:hypothetical protein
MKPSGQNQRNEELYTLRVVALTNLKSLRNFVQFRNRSDVHCLCVFDIYSNLKCASTLTLHYARSKENNMLPEELNKSTGRIDTMT